MTTNDRDSNSPGPGPKGGGADVRGALLEAGASLYEQRGLDPFALKDVAERAGVTQAMVRYYFGDKRGFQAALLDHGFERLFSTVSAQARGGDALRRLIAEMNRSPWLVLLMMQSVYAGDELRAHFMQRHAPRIVALLKDTVEPRPGLDPALVVLSLISMLVFPQLARPAVGPVFGLRFDEAFARDYADHLTKLFETEGGRDG